jgi:hypothetical protein
MQVKKISTCTLNLGGRSLATLYPSLWLCDVKGDIYLLKNLEQYADSYASHLQSQSFVTEEIPRPPAPTENSS